MIIDDKLMNYVLYKMRTVSEVKRKAQSLKLQDDYIDDAIDYLIEAGYLDDENYSRKYVDNVMRLKNASRAEMKNDLLKKGISEDLADKYAYTDRTLEFEEQSATILANKKYKLAR